MNIQLLRDLGLNEVSSEMQAKVLAEFAELVQIRMADLLSQQLSPDEQERLGNLSESSDIEALAEIERLFPQYQELLAKTIAQLTLEIKSQTAEVLDGLKQS